MFEWLDGKKTYIAAAIAAFVAFNEVAHVVSPATQQLLLTVAVALGLYGMRAAIDKIPTPPEEVKKEG